MLGLVSSVNESTGEPPITTPSNPPRPRLKRLMIAGRASRGLEMPEIMDPAAAFLARFVGER
ncbi:MAG TPA: hypothetical protein VHK27_06990 [Gammaproteobacteria bacterium]|nr:hypothetical protein [Gammaproteobacteria bacterium]